MAEDGTIYPLIVKERNNYHNMVDEIAVIAGRKKRDVFINKRVK